MDEDDVPEFNLFAHRADDIIKSKLEAYEKLNNETIEEEEEPKDEGKEYNDLMCKIKEKLKRKPANRKRKKDKIESEVIDEEKPQTRASRRSARKMKLTEDELPEDTNKKSFSPVKLPVTAKRRLNELKLRTDREVAQIEEEIRRTLSSCDNDFLELSESIPLSELEMQTTLKINYMGNISKLQVKENEKFATIFVTVAELYKLKASEILLCLEDRNIQVDDTPQSLKLQFCDVIDCIPYKESEAKDDDPSMLLIKVQSNDSRKKIEMHIHKLEKFQDFMEKYSKLRDIPMKDLKFEFDGETIQGTETPEDLEMESGSCVDVQVTIPDSEEIAYVSQSQQIPPIPQSEMLDICVID